MEHTDNRRHIRNAMLDILENGNTENRLHAAEILLDMQKEDTALSFEVADPIEAWQSTSLTGLAYFFVRCALASIPAFLVLGSVYLVSVVLFAVLSQLMG